MRKFLPVSFFVIVFSIFPIIQAKAFEEVVDQKNTTITLAAPVIYNYGHNQSFTPDKDMLTKVQVHMKDRRNGAGVTLTVKKDSSGETIFTTSHRMGDGTGWEVFNLTNTNAEGFALEKGQLYTIWLKTAYYETGLIPKWTRTGSNVYLGGTKRQNNTVYEDDDFVFATYGYDLPEVEKVVGDQAQDPTDQKDPLEGAQPGQQGSGTEVDTEENSITIDSVPTEEYVEEEEEETNLISIKDLDKSIDEITKSEKDDDESNSFIIIIVIIFAFCLVSIIALALAIILYKSEKFRNSKLGKKLNPIFTKIDSLKNKY